MGIPPPDNAGLYEHNTYIVGGPQKSTIVTSTPPVRTSMPDRNKYKPSDWQFGVPPTTQSQAVYHKSNVWSHDWNAPREASNGAQEVTEQDHDTI